MCSPTIKSAINEYGYTLYRLQEVVMLMEVSVGMRRAGSCHVEAGKKRAQISQYPLFAGYQYFQGPYLGNPAE